MQNVEVDWMDGQLDTPQTVTTTRAPTVLKSQMYKKAPPPPKCGLVGSLTSHPVTAQSKIDTPFHSLPDKQQNVVADVVPPKTDKI